MIDSHAHIDAKAFDGDREDMLQRALEAGVTAIIVPDIEPARRPHLKSVVDSHSFLYRGVGIHPHNVAEISEADLRAVELESTETKVVAIGEIGLDYHYDFAPRDVQKWAFTEQVRIAKRRNLPVIVHNRESDDDVLSILTAEQDGSLQGVLHCFSSDTSVLRRAIDLGLHVSFTGNITFRNSTLDDVVREVPADRFMIETDSPYITPVPFRGKRNEPAHVRLVAEKIAEIRGMTLEDVITTTTATARRFFGLLAVFILVTCTAIAQPTAPNEDDYEFEDEFDRAYEFYEQDSIAWSKWYRNRSFGFGFTIGSNTVVEGQTYVQRYFAGGDRSSPPMTSPSRWSFPKESGRDESRVFSFDGQMSIGASLSYLFSPRLSLEATYLYTKNNGPADEFGLDPVIINVIESAIHYNLNPYSRVNFIANGGVTYASVDDGFESKSGIGVNAGLALGVNVETPIGLLYPMINVRFNFMLGTDENRRIAAYNQIEGEPNPGFPFEIVHPNGRTVRSEDRADITTIYSIPRFTLMFYPNF